MTSETERKSRSQRGLARRLAALRCVSLHGSLFALLALYSLGGAYLFMWLEAPAEAAAAAAAGNGRMSASEQLQSARRQLLGSIHHKGAEVNQKPQQPSQKQQQQQQKKLKAVGTADGDDSTWSAGVERSLEAFEKAVELAVKVGDAAEPTSPKWDFWGSLYYVSTVYTTIGYGNMAPATTAGRVATMVYATFGIPLCLVFLANLGNLVAASIKKFIRIASRLTAGTASKKRKCEHDTPELWPCDRDIESLQGVAVVTVVIALSAAYMGLGVCLYRCWENWSALEAFYFIFISLSTIGFGDVVPTQPRHYVLSSLYVFVGLTLISTAFSAVQSMMASQVDAAKAKADALFGGDASKPAAK